MTPMLFFMLAYVAPAAVLLVAVFRLLKARKVVFVARMDSVRTKARADAAEEAARLAEQRRAEAAGLAAESMAQTADALEIARRIEKIGTQLDTLIDCIGGELAAEPPRRGRHALPDESS